MKIPFPTHSINVDGHQCHSVSEIFATFNEPPTDRRMSELYEAVGFAMCLQIWRQENLVIRFIDEERSSYKGIDFFLSLENAFENGKRPSEAFQLIEFKAKYSKASAAWRKSLFRFRRSRDAPYTST